MNSTLQCDSDAQYMNSSQKSVPLATMLATEFSQFFVRVPVDALKLFKYSGREWLLMDCRNGVLADLPGGSYRGAFGSNTCRRQHGGYTCALKLRYGII